MVETGPLEQLRHLTRTAVTADVAAVPPGLELLPGVHDVVVANHRVSAQVEPAGLAPLMQALTAAGLQSLDQPAADAGGSVPASLRRRQRSGSRRGDGPGPAGPAVRLAPAGGGPAMPETFAGTGVLIRLGLRRDRWLLPVWIAGFALIAYSTAVAGAELVPGHGEPGRGCHRPERHGLDGGALRPDLRSRPRSVPSR